MYEDNVTQNTEEIEHSDVALPRRNDSEYEASVLDDILREIREGGSDTVTLEPLPSPGKSQSTSRRTAGSESQNQMNVRSHATYWYFNCRSTYCKFRCRETHVRIE